MKCILRLVTWFDECSFYNGKNREFDYFTFWTVGRCFVTRLCHSTVPTSLKHSIPLRTRWAELQRWKRNMESDWTEWSARWMQTRWLLILKCSRYPPPQFAVILSVEFVPKSWTPPAWGRASDFHTLACTNRPSAPTERTSMRSQKCQNYISPPSDGVRAASE